MSRITVKDAVAKSAKGEITVIDVREANELKASGTAAGSVHIPLAMLAMKADPKHPDFDAKFTEGKPIAVYCAVGGRAGMAAQVLSRFGHEAHNIGGFGDWVQAGGPVKR
jgi:rhodanese-related sulfurtransferase